MNEQHETDVDATYTEDVYGDRLNRGDGAWCAPSRPFRPGTYGDGRTHPNADDLAYVAAYMKHVTPLHRCGLCRRYSRGPCERCSP